MRRRGPIEIFGSFVPLSSQPRSDDRGTERSLSKPLSPVPLALETLVTAHERLGRHRRVVTVPVSVLLHLGAAVALITVPLLLASELPAQAGAVQAFFVEPLSPPPPPPPPPPPAPAARPDAARPAPAPEALDASARLTAPVEMPAEVRPEEGLDLGFDGGVPGGVEGGVPGGVIGGVVGGLPDGPAAAPPPVTPLRVGGQIKEPARVHQVPPVYPKVAMDARVEGIVIIEAVIDDRGGVAETRILRGVPVLDDAALEAVRQWTYTPTLLNGVPTPVVMTITVTFRLQQVAAL